MRVEQGAQTTPYELTNRFISASLTATLKRYPYLAPYIREFAGFDKETFKHCVLVGEVAHRAFLAYAKHANLPSDEVARGCTVLRIGGLLHDIGKMGIGKNPEESLRILRPEKHTAVERKENNGDTRTKEERAYIHTHVFTGGQGILKLLNDAPETKNVVQDIVDFAFEHHERFGGGTDHLASYGRSTFRKRSSYGVLLHMIRHMSDALVAMAEPREIRNYQSKDKSTINHALSEKISDVHVRAILGQNTPEPTCASFRTTMVNLFMGVYDDLKPILCARDYSIEGMPVNGREWRSTPVGSAHLLPNIFNGLWQPWRPGKPNSYERRVLEFIEKNTK